MTKKRINLNPTLTLHQPYTKNPDFEPKNRLNPPLLQLCAAKSVGLKAK